MTEHEGSVVRLPVQRRATVEPFQPFYVSQMEGKERKPREWMVDGVLMRRTTLLVAGQPKIGKSLLLQQMLTSIAIGDTWLGRQTVRARTFALFCEDPQDALEERQEAINTYHNRSAADLELDFSWDSRDGRDCMLVEFDRYSDKPKFTRLWDQLWDFVIDEGIQVVGLDTAATVFGGNENFRNQTTAFLRELQRMAVKIDGSIVLNAHPSRSSPNSYSGNTGWLASVRAGVSLGRPSDWDEERDGRRDPRRVLRGLGSNYGGGIGIEPLEYNEGVFVPTEPEHRGRSNAPLSHIERQDLKYRLLTGLKRSLMNGAKVPADVMSPGSMPSRARRSTDPQINHVALNELYIAQEDLIENGQVVRVDVGRKCLIRPSDGPYYVNEQPWLPASRPTPLLEAADD